MNYNYTTILPTCVFTCGAIKTETKGKRIKSKLREDISSLFSTYQLKYVNWQRIWDTTGWWQIIQSCQIPIEWKLRLSRNMMMGWAHTGNQCPHVTPNKPDSSWLCSKSQENRNYFIAEWCALSHNLPNAMKNKCVGKCHAKLRRNTLFVIHHKSTSLGRPLKGASIKLSGCYTTHLFLCWAVQKHSGILNFKLLSTDNFFSQMIISKFWS